MLFVDLILWTVTTVLGACGPHCHAPHLDWSLRGHWHPLVARSEFVTQPKLAEQPAEPLLANAPLAQPPRPTIPPAPILVLQRLPPSGQPAIAVPRFAAQLFSVDRPSFWTRVPYGPLRLEVRWPMPPQEDLDIEAIELMLDGEPIDGDSYRVGSSGFAQPLPDGRTEYRSTYDLPCLAPGQHVVQARVKVRRLWSPLSDPLRFDLQLPTPPTIVGLSDAEVIPNPLPPNRRVEITQQEIRLHFANLTADAEVVLYLNGKPFGPTTHAPNADPCCRIARLPGRIVPGVHTLTARLVASETGCPITSEPSNDVVFHFYDEDAYLLRPAARSFAFPQGIPLGQQQRTEPSNLTFTKKQESIPAGQPSSDSTTPATPPVSTPTSTPCTDPADACSPLAIVQAARAAARRSEANADARIATVEAQAQIQRAQATQAPPSPYYFASAAHFPLPGFGLRGETVDRPGAILYEDMRFAFDRDGNYNLRFSAEIPALPTTFHLQLHVQPHDAGPSYTITLAPITLRPEEEENGLVQSRTVHDHVVEGHSEILRHCYPQLGAHATIRRTGSARFGYGLEALRPIADY